MSPEAEQAGGSGATSVVAMALLVLVAAGSSVAAGGAARASETWIAEASVPSSSSSLASLSASPCGVRSPLCSKSK